MIRTSVDYYIRRSVDHSIGFLQLKGFCWAGGQCIATQQTAVVHYSYLAKRVETPLWVFFSKEVTSYLTHWTQPQEATSDEKRDLVVSLLDMSR